MHRLPSTIAPVLPVFTFAHELPFSPEIASDLLREIPDSPGLLALFGPPSTPPSEPFLTRTANLRRRAARLLQPPPPRETATTPDGTPLPTRRLNLRARVARVAFSPTGSDFESLLLLYGASAALFGLPEARRRLRLHTPFFVRFSAENNFPRLVVSNRLGRRSLDHTFGPFPSRLAAERFTDAVLDLFKLRRCWEDLAPFPEHPGCAYGEMRKCLAPCNLSCTPSAYAEEAHAVEQFLHTRGESLLIPIAGQRDGASEAMDFERAAELHSHYEKVKAAIALADPIVRPLPELRAVIVQPAAPGSHTDRLEQAALFLLDAGRLAGPALLPTLGVRAVREQTVVGSSLFAQPLMLTAIPLGEQSPAADTAAPAVGPASTHLITPPPTTPHTLSPEDRAHAALATLTLNAQSIPDADPALLSDHLALFRRWYFRPEKQRTGDLLTPNPDGSWPIRRLLNTAARAAIGDPKPMQPTDRDAARTLKTKILHPGREGVERSVPVLEGKPQPLSDPTFRSRRSRKGPSEPVQATLPAGKLSPP